ncbi:MAG: hypothetical protein QOE70_6128 [Chthoniobacter sp.]|jgi:putative PEP-CTERM system histidine kinase|nr:hypothetical protein [Chthoniobacter sp.]
MLVFAGEGLLQGLSIRATRPEDLVWWQSCTLVAKSIGPGVWLAFSLVYSRGNYREFLRRWRVVLAFVAILPPLIALLCFRGLISPVHSAPSPELIWLALSAPAKLLNALILISVLLILTNFERTFQAAVGTMRWRVKFLLLGLGLIFGARIFTRTQTLLFSGQDLGLVDIETGALLIGCVMIGVAHLRRGLSEVDVYPSHAILQNSVTFVLAGCYLFLVGVLAQVVKWLGGSSTFQLQALIILAGVAGLGVLLLSERLRQRVKYFVSRHLRRPHHDFRQVWRRLTERLASASDTTDSCTAATQMISETFNALSVTVWLLDEQQHWVLGASTSEKGDKAPSAGIAAHEVSDLADLGQRVEPFDLEEVSTTWAGALRAATSQQFSERRRLAVTLRAGQHILGVVVLGDRVYRMPYTLEEFELLRCLADQLAATLLNLRLGQDLAFAREMETFQTMSAFFVHDLKNSASSLNLMLQNLPQHFDNPEFREDALRGLERTTAHINGLIARLSSFRGQLELNIGRVNLNDLILEAIAQMGPRPVAITQDLQLAEPVRLDREQIKSVVINLMTNAHEATPPGGRISIRTEKRDGQAILTLTDDGCGMAADFLRKSLFRPFQTTKKKGIGIGMFQSRMIVEAHQGRIQVSSEPGQGSTFRVLLPLPAR